MGGAWDSIDSDRILAIKVSFFPKFSLFYGVFLSRIMFIIAKHAVLALCLIVVYSSPCLYLTYLCMMLPGKCRCFK